MHYQPDLLERPIKAGDTVMTKGYYDCRITQLAKVLKVNKKTITVQWDDHHYSKEKNKYVYGAVKMRRLASECLVISDNLLQEAKEHKKDFMLKHPEKFI